MIETQTSPAPRLRREDVEAVFPTRPMQQALLLQSGEASKDVGFVQVRCRVDGLLDAHLVQATWQLVFDRHQALRASIRLAPKQGQSVVVVHRRVSPTVDLRDVVEETPAAQADLMATYLAEDRGLALPLDRAPVARLAWFKLAPDRHEFVWTCHHALLDGWSAWLVLDEWQQAYAQLRAGQEVDLPPPVSLRAYQDHLDARDEAAESTFWTERLRGLNPQGLPPPQQGLAEARTLETLLTAEEAAQLEATARTLKVTTGAVVSAAWALVLRGAAPRRSGPEPESDDVVFGSVAFGRPATLSGAASMVGMFINTVPIRCAVSVEQSLTAFVRQIHAEQQAALAYQDAPLERLYAYAQHQGPGRLFDTLLAFQNLPRSSGDERNGAGPRLSEFRSGLNSSFPLAVSVEPGEDGWRLALTLDRPRSGMDPQAWLEAFRNLLVTIPSRAEAEIGTLLPSGLQPTPSTPSRDAEREVVAPTKDLEKILLAIWQRELDVRPALGITDDFFEAGGHSMLAVRVFAEIERQLGCRVPLVALAAHPTVEKLARVVEAQLEGSETEVVMIPLSGHGSRPPLILMPAMGGEALFWQHLEDWGRERPLYTMGLTTPKLPWGDGASLTDMADHFVAAIRRELSPETPIHLAGYSFGGHLAFAVGERLRAAGSRVGTIVIIDTMLDNPPGPTEPRRRQLRPALVNLGRWVQEEIAAFDESRWRSRAERLGRAALRRVGALTASVNPLEDMYETEALPEEHLDRIQQDRDAAAQYRPAPHPGRLVVLRAHRQPLLRMRPWDLNWGQVVSGPLEVIEVPGNHENLVFPPHGRVLARAMRAALIRGDEA